MPLDPSICLRLCTRIDPFGNSSDWARFLWRALGGTRRSGSASSYFYPYQNTTFPEHQPECANRNQAKSLEARTMRIIKSVLSLKSHATASVQTFASRLADMNGCVPLNNTILTIQHSTYAMFLVSSGTPEFEDVSSRREIGVLLLEKQRQHRTLHVQKHVLPCALCWLLCPVSAALASIFRRG